MKVNFKASMPGESNMSIKWYFEDVDPRSTVENLAKRISEWVTNAFRLERKRLRFSAFAFAINEDATMAKTTEYVLFQGGRDLEEMRMNAQRQVGQLVKFRGESLAIVVFGQLRTLNPFSGSPSTRDTPPATPSFFRDDMFETPEEDSSLRPMRTSTNPGFPSPEEILEAEESVRLFDDSLGGGSPRRRFVVPPPMQEEEEEEEGEEEEDEVRRFNELFGDVKRSKLKCKVCQSKIGVLRCKSDKNVVYCGVQCYSKKK
jgi:hypothetical protein